MKTPCKDCEDRCKLCHSNCKLYAEWKAWREEVSAERKRQLDKIEKYNPNKAHKPRKF